LNDYNESLCSTKSKIFIFWSFVEKVKLCRTWWFTSAIPATWEAKIKSIIVGGNPGNVVRETLSQQQKKLGMVTLTVIPALKRRK
jgi:hypothetical protein